MPTLLRSPQTSRLRLPPGPCETQALTLKSGLPVKVSVEIQASRKSNLPRCVSPCVAASIHKTTWAFMALSQNTAVPLLAKLMPDAGSDMHRAVSQQSPSGHRSPSRSTASSPSRQCAAIAPPNLPGGSSKTRTGKLELTASTLQRPRVRPTTCGWFGSNAARRTTSSSCQSHAMKLW